LLIHLLHLRSSTRSPLSSAWIMFCLYQFQSQFSFSPILSISASWIPSHAFLVRFLLVFHVYGCSANIANWTCIMSRSICIQSTAQLFVHRQMKSVFLVQVLWRQYTVRTNHFALSHRSLSFRVGAGSRFYKAPWYGESITET
jgi:hypothetical protein